VQVLPERAVSLPAFWIWAEQVLPPTFPERALPVTLVREAPPTYCSPPTSGSPASYCLSAGRQPVQDSVPIERPPTRSDAVAFLWIVLPVTVTR
jgi:hypothetical protein